MWILTWIGDKLVWLSDRIWDTWKLIDSIPLLSSTLEPIFDVAYNFCWWMRDNLYWLSDQWDSIEAKVGKILSWESIQEYIRATWGFLDNIVDYVWEHVFNKLRAIYPWLDDILTHVWNYVYEKIKQAWGWLEDIPTKIKDVTWEFLTTQFNWITDFWGNVGQAIWDWITVNLLPWLKSQAEKVANLGGEILDLVW